MKKILFLFTLVGWLVTGCYYDNAEELYQNYPQNCDVSAVSYAIDIKPMMETNCAYSGCHLNPGAAQGLDLSTYGAVSANKDIIKSRVNAPAGSGLTMPPSGPMIKCNIQQLTTWIDQGALNN